MAISLENKYGTSAVNATQKNALPPYLDLVLGSIESGYLPLTGGTLTGSLTLSSGEINVNAGNITSGNSSNTQERRVKAHSAAGEIYLYAQGTNPGNRGIYEKDSDGNGAYILYKDSTNNLNYNVGRFLNGLKVGHGNARYAALQFSPDVVSDKSSIWTPGSIRFQSDNQTTYRNPNFVFRQSSPNTTADDGFLGYYEDYALPTCTAGKTGNTTYQIWTTKTKTMSESGGVLTITYS